MHTTFYEKKIHIFDKDGIKTGETEVGESWDGILAFNKDNRLYVILQYREKNEKKTRIYCLRDSCRYMIFKKMQLKIKVK
ncbi:hypothetical protein SAMN02745176_01187 [Lutispora thermophila DSM 19022]|uniref:Uncharacterized protein n=1 Tax=Lutispora thermophila DSM 19022 TaxID=1122184 RepID=A0A1M6DN90_9FIRM|nr:hypothetical protein SAMN02745176_01187 [Lutispora thermophila DSM 19022]